MKKLKLLFLSFVTFLCNANNNMQPTPINLEQLRATLKPIAEKIFDDFFIKYAGKKISSLPEEGQIKLKNKLHKIGINNLPGAQKFVKQTINKALNAPDFNEKLLSIAPPEEQANLKKTLADLMYLGATQEFVATITLNNPKQRVKTLNDLHLVKTSVPEFDWCLCVPIQDRIALIIGLLYEVKQKYPDTAHPLIYTSLASGHLLQDYVALYALLSAGYTNITVNLIEFDLLDAFELNKLVQRWASPQHQAPATSQKQHEKALLDTYQKISRYDSLALIRKEIALYKQQYEAQIQGDYELSNRLFKEQNTLTKFIEEINKAENLHTTRLVNKLRHKLSQQFTHAQITINAYQTAYEYSALAEKNPTLKSNILLLVDPSVSIFPSTPYPYQANAFAITAQPTPTPENIMPIMKNYPDAYVFTPRNRPAKILVSAQTNDQPDVQNLVNELQQLACTTGADKGYSSTFVQEVIARYGSSRLETARNTLEEYKNKLEHPEFIDEQELEQVRTNISTLLNELKEHELPELTWNEEIIKNYSPGDIVNELAIIYLPYTQNFSFSWHTDPHTTFQDLIGKAAKQDAIVYQLYHETNAPINAPAHLERTNSAEYLAKDVETNLQTKEPTPANNLPEPHGHLPEPHYEAIETLCNR